MLAVEMPDRAQLHAGIVNRVDWTPTVISSAAGLQNGNNRQEGQAHTGKRSANHSGAPIRVAFVLHGMQVAGAEVLVKETIFQLRGRITPTIYCLDNVGPLGEDLRAKGCKVQCLHRRPGRDWGLVWRLARAFRHDHIEVIHAHQYSPFFYGALAGALSGTSARIILTEHGRHYPDVVSPLRRAINRLLLDRMAAAVNAVCAFSARSLCRVDGFAGKRIRVIENGIAVERYAELKHPKDLRSKLGLAPDRRYIISVARLHAVKDHATLLRAFGSVAAAHTDVDLLLVGDGPLRGELECLTRDLGLLTRVRFLGIRADVPELLCSADIFAMTSISEAASLTLLEAMAASLPVVVTGVGGNPEIVCHGREGLLVGRGRVDETAAALGQLLDDARLAKSMGTAGRARVRQHYRLERTIEAYADLYEELRRA